MIKKIIFVIFFSLFLYFFFISTKLNILLYNIEKEKEIVCIMFERQVFILENQSLVLNKYVDDIILSEIKMKLYILKKVYENETINEGFSEFEKNVYEITEEIKNLCIEDEQLKELVLDFQIKIEGSQNRLAMAKRDYTKAISEYNTFSNNPFCFIYKLFIQIQSVKNIYVRDLKKEEIDSFMITIGDGGDVFEKAYNSIFNNNK